MTAKKPTDERYCACDEIHGPGNHPEGCPAKNADDPTNSVSAGDVDLHLWDGASDEALENFEKRLEPADEEAVRESMDSAGRMIQDDATRMDIHRVIADRLHCALEASLGVKRYVMAASVDPESTIVEFIDVEDLLAAIRGALEGNDAG